MFNPLSLKKISLALLIVTLFASSAAANSGIFDDSGNVKTVTVSPTTSTVVDAVLPRHVTPAKRETNADRMRRGLSPLPPKRRHHGGRTNPFLFLSFFSPTHYLIFLYSGP